MDKESKSQEKTQSRISEFGLKVLLDGVVKKEYGREAFQGERIKCFVWTYKLKISIQ